MGLVLRLFLCIGCFVGLSFASTLLKPLCSAASPANREVSLATAVPFASPLVLLSSVDVQNELGMDERQRADTDEWLRSFHDSVQSEGRSFACVRDESREMNEEVCSQFRTFIRAKIEQWELQLADMLTDEQFQRVQQLSLQRAGLIAFSQRNVAADLNLTPGQHQRISEISSVGTRPNVSQQDIKNTREELNTILTDSQQNQWKMLIGSQFTFDSPSRPQEMDVVESVQGILR